MADTEREQKIAMLVRANTLINGERQQEYGDKLRNFSQIADFWNAHLKYKLAINQVVTAEDVALMMVNVKQSRLAKTPNHRDSILDVAGYAGCYDKILDEREYVGYKLQGMNTLRGDTTIVTGGTNAKVNPNVDRKVDNSQTNMAGKHFIKEASIKSFDPDID